MTKELNRAFNEEVERYKHALLFYAKKCEWDTFKIKAGRLFDYLESIEISEIRRKFFRIFWTILFVLFFVCIFIFKIDLDLYPALLKFKKVVTLIALAGVCYELYFFLDFNIYMKAKITFYKKRRERFIRNIEQDFKDIIVRLGV